MPAITIPSKDIPQDFKAKVHERVERHFLQGITRLLKDFEWNDNIRVRLKSLLEGRMAIYRQARDEYREQRGSGLENFMEEE